MSEVNKVQGEGMNKKIIITLMLLIIGLGIGLALDQEQPDTRPDWIHEVHWSGEKPSDTAKIEELLWLEIIPYKTEYAIVNISAAGDDKEMHIKITANALDADYPDVYDFVFKNNELLLRGYMLEAVPASYRNEAIRIALNNRELTGSIQNSAVPTVKRILPKISQKFYAQKTLLSVTWRGFSALVDPDERKVVQVWKESENTK